MEPERIFLNFQYTFWAILKAFGAISKLIMRGTYLNGLPSRPNAQSHWVSVIHILYENFTEFLFDFPQNPGVITSFFFLRKACLCLNPGHSLLRDIRWDGFNATKSQNIIETDTRFEGISEDKFHLSNLISTVGQMHHAEWWIVIVAIVIVAPARSLLP